MKKQHEQDEATNNNSREIKSVIIKILVIWSLVMAVVVALYKLTPFGFSELTRDVTAIVNKPPYMGLLSTLGLLVWAGTFSVCFFASRDSSHPFYNILRWGAFLSFLLVMDDAFLLHEEILPKQVGIPEILVVGSYGVMGLAFFWNSWKTILKSPYLLLALAFIGLGASATLDQFMTFSDRETAIEDGLKFFGILSWYAYFFLVARTIHNETETSDVMRNKEW